LPAWVRKRRGRSCDRGGGNHVGRVDLSKPYRITRIDHVVSVTSQQESCRLEWRLASRKQLDRPGTAGSRHRHRPSRDAEASRPCGHTQCNVQALGRPPFVKNILLGKPGNVVTIEPHAELAAAVKLLTERRIGAVVILGADHRIVGILSERDIVRALADRGPGALLEPVSQVMTRVLRRRHHRELDGSHDDGKIPTYAGGGAGKAGWHCVDWRCGQESRRGDRARSRSFTRSSSND
jgi:CBS domain